jgi:hypothetical protein
MTAAAASAYFRKLDAPELPKRSYPMPSSEMQFRLLHQFSSERKLLDQIPRLEADLQKAVVELKKATDAELDRAMKSLQGDVEARDSELRDGLRYVLAGSAANRARGAWLLLGGVVLATAGSVLGNT